MTTDWPAWHRGYDDPTSGVSRRLATVSQQITAWLDQTAPRPVRVVSLCAGDGRDLLEVLEGRADAARVTATLVELDPQLADAARARASQLAARVEVTVEVRCADAGSLTSYDDSLPADLVLLCGVLGNVDDHDVRRTVEAMGWFCAEGGRVIWTRTRREPNLTPSVRKWFTDNGFRELAFVTWKDTVATVGVHECLAPRAGREPGSPLFRFVSEGS